MITAEEAKIKYLQKIEAKRYEIVINEICQQFEQLILKSIENGFRGFKKHFKSEITYDLNYNTAVLWQLVGKQHGYDVKLFKNRDDLTANGIFSLVEDAGIFYPYIEVRF